MYHLQWLFINWIIKSLFVSVLIHWEKNIIRMLFLFSNLCWDDPHPHIRGLKLLLLEDVGRLTSMMLLVVVRVEVVNERPISVIFYKGNHIPYFHILRWGFIFYLGHIISFYTIFIGQFILNICVHTHIPWYMFFELKIFFYLICINS